MQNSSTSISPIPSTPFRFIWFAWKPYKKWIISGVVLVFLQQLFSDLQSYAFKGFIDAANVYNGGSLQPVFIWIIVAPTLLLLTVLTIRGSGFVINYVTVHARTGATKTLFGYLSLHSLIYFNDRFSGALSNKVSVVSANVSRLMHQMNNVLGILFSLIVTLVLISSASNILALAFVSGFVLLVPFNVLLTRRQTELSEKMVEKGAKLQGQVIDAVTNITAVQQYAHRGYEIGRIDKAISEYREADVRSDNFREKVLLINNIIVWIFIATIIVWAFMFWSRQAMSTGELVMVSTLTLGFMRALSHIGQNMNNIMEFYGEVKNGLKEII